MGSAIMSRGVFCFFFFYHLDLQAKKPVKMGLLGPFEILSLWKC